MKVKAIVQYYDLQLIRKIKVGEELDVTEERAATLINAGFCELVELEEEPEKEPEEEPEEEKPTKRGNKKKEA